MRKKIGIMCVCLGVVCLLNALGFIAYNRWEDRRAGEMVQSLLEAAQNSMAETAPEANKNPTEMPTVKVDGYDCIGILSVPVLELELPVLTDWSYAKLKKAPCLYYGTYHEKNFVIAAHNYTSHFGRLSALQPGDLVFFTDVTGRAYSYEVILLETLPEEATEEMITGGFGLSLYTCTPSGFSRVTVRCNTVKGD